MSDDRLSLQGLLLAEDKLVGESQNVLTFLWRHVLQTAMMPSEAMGRWDSLMRRYSQRIQNDPHVPKDVIPKNSSSMKGNLRKELTSPHMTWLNFVKGMYFLNVHRSILRVECYWRDGSFSSHVITVYERTGEASLGRVYLKDILTDLWLDILGYAFEGENRDIYPASPLDHIARWRKLVEQYLDDPRNGIGKSFKKRTSVKGNLKKELLMREFLNPDEPENYLTWKSLEKGISLLNPQKTHFTLTCYWRPGYATHHTAIVKGSRQGVDATTALSTPHS